MHICILFCCAYFCLIIYLSVINYHKLYFPSVIKIDNIGEHSATKPHIYPPRSSLLNGLKPSRGANRHQEMNTNQRLHLTYSLHVLILNETLGDQNCILMCRLRIRTFKIGGWGGNSGKCLPQKPEDMCVCKDMGFSYAWKSRNGNLWCLLHRQPQLSSKT